MEVPSTCASALWSLRGLAQLLAHARCDQVASRGPSCLLTLALPDTPSAQPPLNHSHHVGNDVLAPFR